MRKKILNRADKKFRTHKKLSKLLKIRTERKRRRNNISYSTKKVQPYVPKPRNRTVELKRESILAPENLSFLSGTQEDITLLVAFLEKLRQAKNIFVDLSAVKEIDFLTLSILKTVIDDHSSKKLEANGNFPIDQTCKEYIINSGFLQGFYSNTGKKHRNYRYSHMESIDSDQANIISQNMHDKINMLGKKICYKLIGQEQSFAPLKTTILEICGNALEHSGVHHWVMGVENKETFFRITICDIGDGIYKTLHRDFSSLISDFFTKSKETIVWDAFKGAYESRTKEKNRNKGLPEIKRTLDNKYIKNFVLLTNDVYITDNEKSFPIKSSFSGTAYMFEIDKSCILQYKPIYDNMDNRSTQ